MSPDKVHELNARTNQWIRRLALVGLALLVVLNAITAAAVGWAIFDDLQQTRINGQTLAIVLAVTGCTVDDTPEQCRARVRATDVAEGTRRIVEVDCIQRRLHAGLPAPDPTRFCTEQTPPEIYPGELEPPR